MKVYSSTKKLIISRSENQKYFCFFSKMKWIKYCKIRFSIFGRHNNNIYFHIFHCQRNFQSTKTSGGRLYHIEFVQWSDNMENLWFREVSSCHRRYLIFDRRHKRMVMEGGTCLCICMSACEIQTPKRLMKTNRSKLQREILQKRGKLQ